MNISPRYVRDVIYSVSSIDRDLVMIRIILSIALLVVVVGFLILYFEDREESTSFSLISFSRMEPIDELVTHRGTFDLLDLLIKPPSNSGFSGRISKLLSSFKSGKTTKIKGFCFKEYSYSFGYRNIFKGSGQDVVKNIDVICNASTLSDLPKPELLSVNAISSSREGDYTFLECSEFDVAPDDGSDPPRDAQIINDLKDKLPGQYGYIVKKSQKTLQSIYKPFCSIVQENKDEVANCIDKLPVCDNGGA